MLKHTGNRKCTGNFGGKTSWKIAAWKTLKQTHRVLEDAILL
jgi:hypothetical protein